MSVNNADDSVSAKFFSADKFSLFLWILLDLVFIALFFIDGRTSGEAAFLTREFVNYTPFQSVADLLVRHVSLGKYISDNPLSIVVM